MYQSMARHPQDSVLPMAAAFGRIKGESTNLQDPVVDGYISEDATPWAKQFKDDFDYWCAAIDDVDAAFAECGYRYFHVFTDPHMKEQFLALDPTILRAWEQTVMIPATTLPDTVTSMDHTTLPTQSYQCPHCDQSFPTFRQLRTHESTKHDIRCAATLFTPTNCCPNCNTIFASQASAIQHLKNSMSKGYCTSNRAHNLQQLKAPTHLHCAYCAALDPENTHMYDSLDSLCRHIKTTHLFDLPVHSKNGKHPEAGEEKARKKRRTRRLRGKKRETKRQADPDENKTKKQKTEGMLYGASSFEQSPGEDLDFFPAIGEDLEACCTPNPDHSEDLDFFPVVGEDPEAYCAPDSGHKTKKQRTEEMPLGASSFEQSTGETPEDSHISDADATQPPEKKIRTSEACTLSTQNAVTTEQTRTRIRGKSTPYNKHITQANNITIAHATPPPAPKTIQKAIVHQKALVTRGDLVATSKYYQHHKSLGHTPKRIQQVTGTQKKRLLQESGLPANMHTQVFLVQDKSVQFKKQKHERSLNPPS